LSKVEDLGLELGDLRLIIIDLDDEIRFHLRVLLFQVHQLLRELARVRLLVGVLRFCKSLLALLELLTHLFKFDVHFLEIIP